LKRLYTQKEVSRLVGVSESQIRYWDRTGLISSTEKQSGTLLFDFTALVAFRTVKALLDKGVSTRRIRKCVESVKERMPEIKHPLTEVHLAIYGNEVVICKDNLRFTPYGQMIINFSPEEKAGEPVPVNTTEDLFFQALESECVGDWERAEKKYRRVLSRNPDHADTLVNLGNIRHHAARAKEAETYYRRALYVDPNHVEANYNLANLLEDRNDLDNAVLFYSKSVHEDPEFADGHFNLGMVLEKMGNRKDARKHWRIYLELDPEGEWADYLRDRLDV